MNYHISSEVMQGQLTTIRNYLGVKKIDRFNDRKRGRLVLMISCTDLLDDEINCSIKGNKLVVEAPYRVRIDRPYHTHNLDSDVISEEENDVSVIGFSEIRLKSGYHYTVISSQLINPGLIKVILSYKKTLVNTSKFKFL